jgi:hypothetical protein
MSAPIITPQPSEPIPDRELTAEEAREVIERMFANLSIRRVNEAVIRKAQQEPS